MPLQNMVPGLPLKGAVEVAHRQRAVLVGAVREARAFTISQCPNSMKPHKARDLCAPSHSCCLCRRECNHNVVPTSLLAQALPSRTCSRFAL